LLKTIEGGGAGGAGPQLAARTHVAIESPGRHVDRMGQGMNAPRAAGIDRIFAMSPRVYLVATTGRDLIDVPGRQHRYHVKRRLRRTDTNV
jgi:hypothetical protein